MTPLKAAGPVEHLTSSLQAPWTEDNYLGESPLRSCVAWAIFPALPEPQFSQL